VISFLEGTLIERGDGYAVIQAGGLGFEVACSNGTLTALGSPAKPGSAGTPVRVFTYLHVREDALQLFGFADRAEREVFQLLIGVSGVGPKVALALLSAFTPDALAAAVAADDAAHISSVPGIGKKTAERVILELKDKLGVPQGLVGSKAGVGGSNAALEDARQALLGLGYNTTEVRLVLGEVGGDGDSAEDLIKAALKRLGK
jgi:Holliday junction DNA helicase RuvA